MKSPETVLAEGSSVRPAAAEGLTNCTFREGDAINLESIADGSFYALAPFAALGAHLRKTGGTLHLMGLVGNGGVHAIDTARFLLGDPEPVRVTASIGTAYGDYPVDDDGVVLIEWSNGVRSVVECGWWQPRLDGVEAEIGRAHV